MAYALPLTATAVTARASAAVAELGVGDSTRVL
jgi:hypothetical protein